MKTLEEIRKIREEKIKELDIRVNSSENVKEKHILVCHGTGCTSSKSPKIIENFRKILEEKNIENVRVIQTGCFGLCSKGPIVIIRPEDVFYAMVTPEDCEEIINTHIIEGKIVERLLCKDTNNSKFIFNDNIESLKPIDGDTRNGAILTFGKRDNLGAGWIARLDGACESSPEGVHNPDSDCRLGCDR